MATCGSYSLSKLMLASRRPQHQYPKYLLTHFKVHASILVSPTSFLTVTPSS